MPQTQIGTTRFVTLATYAANRPVEGKVVTVLDSSHAARGLKLMPTYSRALQKKFHSRADRHGRNREKPRRHRGPDRLSRLF